MVIFSIVMK